MTEFKFTLTDPAGLHVRPAGMLVKIASDFSSEITLRKGAGTGNAKSIFSIMGLAIKCGDEITVSASGDDEQRAVDALNKFCSEHL